MGKKYRSKHRSIASLPLFSFFCNYSAFFVAILFFFAVCLCLQDNIKWIAMILMSLVLVCGLLRFSTLRERISFPLIALFLVVLMDGLSIFYAVTRKLALYEFLQVLAAFCLALLLLMLAKGKGVQPGRWIAAVLEGSAALAGLVSIDLISTRWISTPVLSVLGHFTRGYSQLSALIPETRINSLYANPNVFASIVGLGVLLSLGMALSAQGRWERCLHTACLFINALSFVLAFSMGASAMIAIAFLVYLLLERGEKRGALFLLMAETLVLTLCAAMLVSVTSFHEWTEPRPIPLLCALGGAAALCLIDQLGVRFFSEKLRGSRLPLFLIGGFLVLIAIYIPVALRWTEGTALSAGEHLIRSAYLAPGDYVLQSNSEGPVSVYIYSENQQEVIMGNRTILYNGELAEAAFTVPEDSRVVFFNFSTAESAQLNSVTYTGPDGGDSIPLKYKLLPSFVANRLQGALASTSGTLRLAIFADAMKLFRRNPILGLGMGSFENGIKSVQSFYYVTQYAHNHYIQSLADTGIVGLALFIALIGVSAASVLLARKKEDAHPLLPALGAALFFMAAHAAVELIFSIYCYLPMAFGVFALIALCCGDSLPAISRKVKNGILVAIAVPMCVFAVLLSENMQAASIFARNPTFDGLVLAAEHDKFEWADYILAYVTNSTNPSLGVDDDIRQQADIYAEQLSHLDSNIVPYRLAEYYFSTGRMERGLEMAEKYVRYLSSDQEAWQRTFQLLDRYERDDGTYREGVLRIAQIMDTWNEENWGTISLSEENTAFLARMRGEVPEEAS